MADVTATGAAVGQEAPRSAAARLGGVWRLATIGALMAACAGAAAWWAATRMLPWVPDVPERLPASLARHFATMSHEPDWDAMAHGPLLADVRRRGELVIGVRAYPRPAPAGHPTPPEPDTFDVEFGKFLAGRLHVRLRVVNLRLEADGNAVASLPGVDLVLASSATRRAVATVQSGYTGGPGQLVALRGGPMKALDDLRGRRVCLAAGGPYAESLKRAGADRRVYESTIRAVSAFQAGECDALAEDEILIERLLGLPEWRFYRRLEGSLASRADGGKIAMRIADDESAKWLDMAVRYWKTGGAFAAAREQRAANVGYETSLLLNGFVCHA